MATNCSSSSVGKKRKYETTHQEQSDSKLSCTNKQQCDIIELSRNNSLKFKEQETSKAVAQRG